MLCSVTFVYQNKDVVTLQGFSYFFNGRIEFVDDGGDYGIAITFEQLHQSLSSGSIIYELATLSKSFGNLIIQIGSVGYQNNFWIADGWLHGNSLCQHHHG